jgi:hypothetical protein
MHPSRVLGGLSLGIVLWLPFGCGKSNQEATQSTTAVQSTVNSAEQVRVPETTVQVASTPLSPIGTQVQGSCSFMGVSCADFQGNEVPKLPKQQCDKYGGKWSNGPCPRDKIQGICTKLEPPFRTVTYSYPPGTLATAKQACDNTPGGVFSAPR